MRKILLLMLLPFVYMVSAQQITIDTTVPSNPAEPGEITEYWWWAWGVEVKGDGFTPNSTVAVKAADSNGWYWREFSGTTNANGEFSVRVNAMRNRSVVGIHNVTATDLQNIQATGNFTVIKSPTEVLEVTSSAQEISMSDILYNSGITLTATGFNPNAVTTLYLLDPSGNSMQVDPTNPTYSDSNGQVVYHVDATTELGNLAIVYSLPQIPGVWTASFNEFSDSNFSGYTKFRIWPDVLGEYCLPTMQYGVQPISKVEFNDLSKQSSLTATEAYEDFTSETANVEAGETYTIKLQGKAQWSFNVNTYTVFIDWNQNGVLDEEGEVYSAGFLLGSTGEDGQQVEYDITIPETALNGETRMRVLKVHSASPTAMFWPEGSCGNFGYGQIEDYTVNISGGVIIPECTISCPENITIQAESGQTTANVDYTVAYECDTMEGVEIVLVEGLASGSAFPIGTTTVTHNVVFNGEVLETCSFDITVEEFMNVSDLSKNSLNVYPNPVKDILNISDNKEISNISIYDLSGKKVYTQKAINKQVKINLAHLSTGVYLVKANVNGEIKTFKIVKK